MLQRKWINGSIEWSSMAGRECTTRRGTHPQAWPQPRVAEQLLEREDKQRRLLGDGVHQHAWLHAHSCMRHGDLARQRKESSWIGRHSIDGLEHQPIDRSERRKP